MTTLEQPTELADDAEARLDAFREQLQHVRVPGSRPERDRLVSSIAVAAMVVAVALGVIAYLLSRGASNQLEQNDAVVLALLGVTLAVVGVGVFVKKGVERLLRFWIARITFEQATQTDRLLAQGEQLRRALGEQAGDRAS